MFTSLSPAVGFILYADWVKNKNPIFYEYGTFPNVFSLQNVTKLHPLETESLRLPCDGNHYLIITVYAIPVLRIRDVIPDPGSEFFHPGSQVKKIPDPGSASKNLSNFNQKNCF